MVGGTVLANRDAATGTAPPTHTAQDVRDAFLAAALTPQWCCGPDLQKQGPVKPHRRDHCMP